MDPQILADNDIFDQPQPQPQQQHTSRTSTGAAHNYCSVSPDNNNNGYSTIQEATSSNSANSIVAAATTTTTSRRGVGASSSKSLYSTSIVDSGRFNQTVCSHLPHYLASKAAFDPLTGSDVFLTSHAQVSEAVASGKVVYSIVAPSCTADQCKAFGSRQASSSSTTTISTTIDEACNQRLVTALEEDRSKCDLTLSQKQRDSIARAVLVNKERASTDLIRLCEAKAEDRIKQERQQLAAAALKKKNTLQTKQRLSSTTTTTSSSSTSTTTAAPSVTTMPPPPRASAKSAAEKPVAPSSSSSSSSPNNIKTQPTGSGGLVRSSSGSSLQYSESITDLSSPIRRPPRATKNTWADDDDDDDEDVKIVNTRSAKAAASATASKKAEVIVQVKDEPKKKPNAVAVGVKRERKVGDDDDGINHHPAPPATKGATATTTTTKRQSPREFIKLVSKDAGADGSKTVVVDADSLLGFIRALQDGSDVANPFSGLDAETAAVIHSLSRPSLGSGSGDRGASLCLSSYQSQNVADEEDIDADDTTTTKVKKSSAKKNSDVKAEEEEDEDDNRTGATTTATNLHLLRLHAVAAILAHPACKLDLVGELPVDYVCEGLGGLAENICKSIKKAEQLYLERQAAASMSSSARKTTTTTSSSSSSALPITSQAAVSVLLPQPLVSALGRASRIMRSLTTILLHSELSDEIYEKLHATCQSYMFLHVSCASANSFVGATLCSLCADSALLLHHACWAWGVSAPQRSGKVSDFVTTLPWSKELYAAHCPLIEASCFSNNGDINNTTTHNSSSKSNNKGAANAADTTADHQQQLFDGMACPLSIATVLAVQAFPVLSPTTTSTTDGTTTPSLTQVITERLTSSSRSWVGSLLSRCFAGGGDNNGGEMDSAIMGALGGGGGGARGGGGGGGGVSSSASDLEIGHKLLARMTDDWCAMIGSPQFPAADVLLKALIYHLTHNYIKASFTPSSSSNMTVAAQRQEAQLFERNRAAAVDIFGRIALALYRYKDPKEIRNVITNDTVLSEWCTKMSRDSTSSTSPGKRGGGRGAKSSSSKGANSMKATEMLPEHLTLLHKVQCSAFHGLNRRSQLCGEPGEGALWYSARQVHIIMWASMSTTGSSTTSGGKGSSSSSSKKVADTLPSPTEDAFDSLLKDDTQVLCADADDSSETLKSLVVFASSYNRRSIVHPETTEAVLLGILSVFKTASSPTTADESSNNNTSSSSSSTQAESVVRKRAMVHVAVLLDMFPALLKAAWGVAREGIADDAARVRESSVFLLQTIAEKCLNAHHNSHFSTNNNITPSSSSSSSKKGIRGSPNIAMVSASNSSPQSTEPKMLEYMKELGHGALSAIVHLIHDQSDAVVTRALVALDTTLKAVPLDNPTTMYVLSRVLNLISTDDVGRYHTMVAKLFYDRWFCSGGGSDSAKDLLTIMTAMERGGSSNSVVADAPTSTSSAEQDGVGSGGGDGSGGGLHSVVSNVQDVAKLFGRRVDALQDDDDIPLDMLSRAQTTKRKSAATTTSSSSSKSSSSAALLTSATSALKNTVYYTLDVEELLDEWASLLQATMLPPYEPTEDHPLVVVFSIIAAARTSSGGGGGGGVSSTDDGDDDGGGMRSLLAANAASGRKAFTTGGSTSGAKSSTARNKGVLASKKGFLTSDTLVNARCALCCRMFLLANRRGHSGQSGGGGGGGSQMALVSLLSSVDARWCAGLQEVMTQIVESASEAPPNSSSTIAENDASNISIPQDDQDAALPVLHTCRSIRSVFEQVEGSLPAPRLLGSLSKLVFTYTGPYAERIVSAAVASMAASIEVGRLPNGKLFNKVPLRHCYVLLNRFFLQAAQCVPMLKQGNASLVRAVGVLVRTLYSTADLLRGYVWQRLSQSSIDQHLKGDAALTAPAPNRLCDGNGILTNYFNLVKAVKQAASALLTAANETDDAQESSTLLQYYGKVQNGILRVVGALCVLVPTDYFRQCEGIIREGLMTPNDSPSAALVQLQALSILYDFLIDEERRVNIAAMADAAQQRQQQHSTICSELDIANNDAVFSSNKNDLNSGMATWVLQQFHTHVLGLFSTSCSQAVRERAFNIIEVALYQGLLAPSVYTEALMSGSVGRTIQGTMRAKALTLLGGVLERHESAVVPKIPRSIVKGYDAIIIGLAEQERLDIIAAAASAASSNNSNTPQRGGSVHKSIKLPPISAPPAPPSLSVLLGSAVLVRETSDGELRSLRHDELLLSSSTSSSSPSSSSSSSLEGPVLSVAAGLYSLLASHKKRREQFVSGVVRLMYQESKLAQYIKEHVAYPCTSSSSSLLPFPTSSSLAATETVFLQLQHALSTFTHNNDNQPSAPSTATTTTTTTTTAAAKKKGAAASATTATTVDNPSSHPPTSLSSLSCGAFVGYLGMLISFLPYQIEGEVTHLIGSIRSALDVTGQTAEDDMQYLLGKISKRGGDEDSASTTTAKGRQQQQKKDNTNTASSRVVMEMLLSSSSFHSHRYPGHSIKSSSSSCPVPTPSAVRLPGEKAVEVLAQIARIQAVIILVAIKEYLRREYALSAAKMLRRQQQAHLHLSTTADDHLGDAGDDDDDVDISESDMGDGSMTGPPKPKRGAAAAKKKKAPSAAATGNARLPVRHPFSKHAVELIDRISSAINTNAEIEAAMSEILRTLPKHNVSASSSSGRLLPNNNNDDSNSNSKTDENGGEVSVWNDDDPSPTKPKVRIGRGRAAAAAATVDDKKQSAAASTTSQHQRAQVTLSSALERLDVLLSEALEEDLKDMMAGEGGGGGGDSSLLSTSNGGASSSSRAAKTTTTTATKRRQVVTVAGKGKRRRDDDEDDDTSSDDSGTSDEDDDDEDVHVQEVSSSSSSSDDDAEGSDNDDGIWEEKKGGGKKKAPAAATTAAAKKKAAAAAAKPPPKRKGARTAK